MRISNNNNNNKTPGIMIKSSKKKKAILSGGQEKPNELFVNFREDWSSNHGCRYLVILQSPSRQEVDKGRKVPF